MGTRLVRIDPSGYVQTVGYIPGTDYAYMARNAAQIVQVAIVSAGERYVYENGQVHPLVDSDLPAPNSCTFLNARLIFGIPDGRFFWSDLNNADSINALSFATAEGNPDGCVRVFEHRLDLWIFGQVTTEIWRDTGSTTSTFQRAPGGLIRRGCAAPASVAALGSELYWVGDHGAVCMANGYVPIDISSEAVNASILHTDNPSLITGASYYFKGLGFYEISGPNWTWVYNRATQTWFEAKTNGLDRRQTQMAAIWNNKIVWGDFAQPNLYTLSDTNYTEAGALMPWELQSPPMNAYPNRLRVNRLYLDFVTGQAPNSVVYDTANPNVQVSWSDDGAKTFSNIRTYSLGPQGGYDGHVEFNGLGATSRQGRIWKLRITSPVARGLLGAAIEGAKIGT
jgi:hypothetical protein